MQIENIITSDLAKHDSERVEKDLKKIDFEFTTLIREPWENLRPHDRDKSGKIKTESNFDNFSEVYNETVRQRDKAELERIKADFQIKEKGKMGTISETILMEGIYELQWLTPDIEVVPTHEYDDIKHGIDFVLRLQDIKQDFLFLGVDVTTLTEEADIERKRDKVCTFLKRGRLGYLKYHLDQVAGIKGELDLPRIVVVFNKPRDIFKLQEIMIKIRKREALTGFEQEKLEAVRQEFEMEVLDQLEANMYYLKELIIFERRQNKGRDTFKTQQYTQCYEAYQEILKELKRQKKEAHN